MSKNYKQLGVLLAALLLTACAGSTGTDTKETTVSNAESETVVESEVTTEEIVTAEVTETTAETEPVIEEEPLSDADKDALRMYHEVLNRYFNDEEVYISFFDYNADGNYDMLYRPVKDVVEMEGQGMVLDKQYIFEYERTKYAVDAGEQSVQYDYYVNNFNADTCKVINLENNIKSTNVLITGQLGWWLVDGYCMNVVDICSNNTLNDSIYIYGDNSDKPEDSRNYGSVSEKLLDICGLDKTKYTAEDDVGFGVFYTLTKEQSNEVIDKVNGLQSVCKIPEGIFTSQDLQDMSSEEFIDKLLAD